MFAAVIALLVFLAAVYVASTIWENRHLPLGPFPLPTIGNLLSIGQKMPYLANLAKKYGKVFRVHMGSRKVIVLSSYELAREALVIKAKDFAGRPPHLIFGRKLKRFLSDGKYCTKWRSQLCAWLKTKSTSHRILKSCAQNSVLTMETILCSRYRLQIYRHLHFVHDFCTRI